LGNTAQHIRQRDAVRGANEGWSAGTYHEN
jgi:hypothetical protein